MSNYLERLKSHDHKLAMRIMGKLHEWDYHFVKQPDGVRYMNVSEDEIVWLIRRIEIEIESEIANNSYKEAWERGFSDGMRAASVINH